MQHIKIWLPCILVLLAITAGNASQYSITFLSNRDGVYQSFRSSIAGNQMLIRQLQHRIITIENNPIPIPQLSYAEYRIREGENIFLIASKMGLDPDTLISVNNIPSIEAVQEGMTIIIPNMRGILYQVEETQTFLSLQQEYKLAPLVLKQINEITRDTLYQGEEIFIPGGKLSQDEWAYFNHRTFLPPLAGRLRVTSPMGWRQDPFTHKRTYHGGVDLGAPMGTPVRASQSGEVLHAGWAGGYGKLVIIGHRYHYKTYYGHLSSILVRKGQRVSRGDRIGLVGSTGRSTGPHLHYEIRRFSLRKNPMALSTFNHR